MLIAFMYNLVAVPLRATFDLTTQRGALCAWLVADYLCDLVYLLDVAMVKSHLSFVSGGVSEVRL